MASLPTIKKNAPLAATGSTPSFFQKNQSTIVVVALAIIATLAALQAKYGILSTAVALMSANPLTIITIVLSLAVVIGITIYVCRNPSVKKPIKREPETDNSLSDTTASSTRSIDTSSSFVPLSSANPPVNNGLPGRRNTLVPLSNATTTRTRAIEPSNSSASSSSTATSSSALKTATTTITKQAKKQDEPKVPDDVLILNKPKQKLSAAASSSVAATTTNTAVTQIDQPKAQVKLPPIDTTPTKPKPATSPASSSSSKPPAVAEKKMNYNPYFLIFHKSGYLLDVEELNENLPEILTCCKKFNKKYDAFANPIERGNYHDPEFQNEDGEKNLVHMLRRIFPDPTKTEECKEFGKLLKDSDLSLQYEKVLVEYNKLLERMISDLSWLNINDADGKEVSWGSGSRYFFRDSYIKLKQSTDKIQKLFFTE